MKQKIGFLVLKSGGNEEARYLYPTVLYHLALRSRIKRELETGKVLRCCCREDETEVTVNENLELQFRTVSPFKFLYPISYNIDSCYK